MFFEYCLRSLGVLRDGERALQNRQNVPRGVVKIAIPYVLGQSLIGPLLASFLDLYPDVRLVSVLTDDAVGLLRAGFDVALAVGPFADSELVAVKLGITECGIFGAPGYFERKGMPQNHVELPRFDLLATGTVDRRHRWPLHTDTEQVTVEFSPRLVCNDLILLRPRGAVRTGDRNLASLSVQERSGRREAGRSAAGLAGARHELLCPFRRSEGRAGARAIADRLSVLEAQANAFVGNLKSLRKMEHSVSGKPS